MHEVQIGKVEKLMSNLRMPDDEHLLEPRLLYLDLLKRTLLNWHYAETVVSDMPEWSYSRKFVAKLLRRSGLKACAPNPIPLDQLMEGKDPATKGSKRPGADMLNGFAVHGRESPSRVTDEDKSLTTETVTLLP